MGDAENARLENAGHEIAVTQWPRPTIKLAGSQYKTNYYSAYFAGKSKALGDR